MDPFTSAVAAVKRPLGALLSLWLLATAIAAGATQDPEREREAAVVLARDGRTGEALQHLERLYHQNPSETVLHDLISVAHWHGADDRAVELATEVNPEQAPAWALSTIAAAHRNEGLHRQAARWYRHCDRARPEALECLLAAAASLHRAGDTADAKALLTQRIHEQPGETPLYQALFDLHFEAGDIKAALRVMDRLVEDTDGSFEARRLAALSRAWSEQLGQAQQQLQALVEERPGAVAPRLNLAMTYRWRDWPRRALTEYERVLEQEPEHPEALTARAEVLLELGEFGAERDTRRRLHEHHPEATALDTLRGERRRLRGWHLHAGLDAGRSESDFFGSREFQAHWRLNTPMLTDHSRAYVWQRHEWARFPEGNGRDTRYGLGLEHRRRNWHGWTEFHGSADRNLETGVGAGATLTTSDHWQLGARVDSAPGEIPLRGRRTGVTGELAQLNLGYHWHERRSAGLTVTGVNTSDDNRRRAVSARLVQRAYTGARTQLDAELELYGSRNSLPDQVSYFNPEQDLSVVVGLSAHRRGWSGHGYRLQQQAGVHIGSYTQRGVETGLIGGVHYGHAWTLPAGNRIHYSGRANRRIFDGDSEMQFGLHVNLDWWFRRRQ